MRFLEVDLEVLISVVVHILVVVAAKMTGVMLFMQVVEESFRIKEVLLAEVAVGMW